MDSIFLSPQIGKKVFSQKISLPFFKEWQTFKGQLIPVNSRKTGDNEWSPDHHRKTAYENSLIIYSSKLPECLSSFFHHVKENPELK